VNGGRQYTATHLVNLPPRGSCTGRRPHVGFIARTRGCCLDAAWPGFGSSDRISWHNPPTMRPGDIHPSGMNAASNAACFFGLVLVLSLASCRQGTSTPPAAPSPPPPPASVAASPPPAPRADGPSAPYATVASIDDSRDSPGFKRVKIVFHNPMHRPCSVTRYVLTWPGGKKPAEPEPFQLAARDARERSLRVHPNDGDLSTLTVDVASVALETDCASGSQAIPGGTPTPTSSAR
jgi:hypothetical protein